MKRTFVSTFLVLLLACTSTSYSSVEHTSAKIYLKQGDYTKAIEFYDLAIAKEPENVDALFERGEFLGIIATENMHIGLRNKIAGDAEDPQRIVLEKMIKDFSGVRAIAATGNKKAQKLEKKMNSTSEILWWNFYGKAVAADSTYRAMDTAGSMENSELVVQGGLKAAAIANMIDPENWSSRFVYAQLRGFQEKDEEYVSAWHEALNALENSDLRTKEPENYRTNHYYAHLQLIQHFYAQKDYARTIETSDQILAVDPASIEAPQYKAFSLATMASDDQRPDAERDSLKRVALAALDRAKELNPDDEIILFYIGQFNLQLKDTSAAMTAFDVFLEKAPNDRDVLFTQGLICLEGGERFGDLNKAVEKFGAITDAFPEDGPAWINYGIALIRLGKTSEGSDAIRKGESLSGN